MRWLRRHTHIIAFQFYTGRARSMWICFVGCEFLFDIWEYLHHITPQRIRIIYDSGAVFFWFWHYCFCEDSQIARTSRRHVSSARRFDSLCDTPFHTVTIGVNVVSTECLRGFRYAVNFVDGYTSLHCLFMWTKNEVTTKLEEFISDF